MIAGYSPQVAALYGMVSTIVVSWVRRETRMGPEQIWQALVNAGKNCVFVAALAGCVGVLIGVLSLTGIIIRFPYMLIELAGQSILITIGLIAIATFVLGFAFADHRDLFGRRGGRGTGVAETRRADALGAFINILAEPRFQYHAAGGHGAFCRGGHRPGRSDENRLGLFSLRQNYLRHAVAVRLHPHSAHRHAGAKYWRHRLGDSRHDAFFDHEHRLFLREDEFNRMAAVSRRHGARLYSKLGDRIAAVAIFSRCFFGSESAPPSQNHANPLAESALK